MNSKKVFDAEGRYLGLSNQLNQADQTTDEQREDGRQPAESVNEEAKAGLRARKVGARSAAEPIGNRNPPRAACFKPGVSGNPKGRPKGQSLRAIFLKAAGDGMDKSFAAYVKADPKGTKLEAVISSLFRKAHYGDANALRQVLALQREFVNDDEEAGNETLAADSATGSANSG